MFETLKLATYLKRLFYFDRLSLNDSVPLENNNEVLNGTEESRALTEIRSRINLIQTVGDADPRYVDERLKELTAGDAELKAALELMVSYIETELPPGDRAHTRNHLVRYLTTYDLVPQGPGLMLDVAHSPIYATALSALKQWSIEKVPILAIDYEKDTLPFADNSMDGVLLCEVIEHFVDDPLFCLIEINRVLKQGGFLLLSTPNVASWFGLYRLLASKHPYRWPVYAHGHKNAKNHIHSREYVPDEVRELLAASGFKVMRLITADYAISPAYPRLPAGDPSERGETIFCIGTKVNLPKKRTYTPLYLSDHNF